jgi:hypothetical protein
MKISLNMGPEGPEQKKRTEARVLEHDILAAKDGDWNAKGNLVRMFMPLLTSLAEKRTAENAKMNAYIEAGKKGIFTAAKKYKKNIGPEGFEIFALDFIESAMDRAADGAGGFFSRLFGKS